MGVFDDIQSYRSALNGGSGLDGVLRQSKTQEEGKDPTEEVLKSTQPTAPKYDLKEPIGYLLNALNKDGYNLDELEPIIRDKGSQLIEAGAGTGKTTQLIFKIQADIISGEATKIVSIPGGQAMRVLDKIFVGTFLNTGAKELRDALFKVQKKYGYLSTAGDISFSTLHAEFKRALNGMGVITNMISAAESRTMLRKVLSTYNVTREDGKPLTSDDYRIIEGIFTYVRNRLDNQRYNVKACEDYGLTPTIIDGILNTMKQMRWASNLMDFEDLQEVLYEGLKTNQAVRDYVVGRYKYMYLDEFQDTSQIQYEIIKYYAVGLKKIIVIGDSDQCIYTWRGSDVNIIGKRFEEDFKPHVFTLTRNYRCPENILNPIINSIEVNEFRHEKTLRSAHEGGELYPYMFRSYSEMLKTMMEGIESDVRNGKSVAVLCRTNFEGMIPAFYLEEKRICTFSISGDNMTMSSPLPRKLLAVTSLFMEKSSANVKQTLEMFVPSRRDVWKVSELVKVLKNNRKGVFDIPMEDIEYSCRFLVPLIRELKDLLEQDKTGMAALRTLYLLLKFKVFDGSSAYCDSARAYIDMLLLIIDSHDFTDVYDFREYIDEINERLKGRIGKSNVGVQVATVHESKGKEWDSVYIWNDSEGSFPSSQCDMDNQEQVEEERRIHYIAWTRARKKLTVLAKVGRLSPFIKEAGVVCSAPVLPSGRLGKGAMDTMNVDGEDYEVTPVFEGTSEANPTATPDPKVADPNPTGSTPTDSTDFLDLLSTEGTDSDKYLSFNDLKRKRMGTIDGIK